MTGQQLKILDNWVEIPGKMEAETKCVCIGINVVHIIVQEIWFTLELCNIVKSNVSI